MRKTTILAIVAATLATPALFAASPTIACKGDEKNLATYLQIHKVLFMERDASRVEEFYAPEVISHNTDTGGSGARKVNSKQLAAMWSASKKNNPERVLDDELILCADDFIVVRTTLRSNDATGVAGNAPTGKAYVTTATDIYRFENGRVVERWGNSDVAGVYQQLGFKVVPGTP